MLGRMTCAAAAVLMFAACGGSSSAAISKPITLGSGYNVLVAAPSGGHPSITSARAEDAIKPVIDMGLWAGARRVQFGLARVTTSGTDLGDLVNRLAWIAVYSVPATDIPPGTGTATHSAVCHWPANARVDIVVVIDAQSGDPGIWNQVDCP